MSRGKEIKILKDLDFGWHIYVDGYPEIFCLTLKGAKYRARRLKKCLEIGDIIV